MEDWQGRTREPITEERLEKALGVLADIVREHGEAFAPLLETMEQELATFRRIHEAVGEKAKQHHPKIADKAA
ncbi:MULTISPECIES: hypothetical protein [Microvirga]|uniref:hypothetical protein n=1 Tax=Microvirga TaxID=186650 RepID=UPI001CFF6730|nr:hypothetical protein [Microvirga lenta]MCB5175512.1 hypothetical protein [Microvirga lenta]